MSTDKTLADVQPGGMVRLGDQLPPLPYPNYPVSKTGLQNNAYTASQMWDYARAALSAQPSPGGQDAHEMADALERIAAGSLSDYEGVKADELHILRCVKLIRDLAVRQPVNESPMAKMAAALRGKAEAERAAFDQRVQSGEWGPMPDNPDVLELPPLPEEVDSVRCMIRGEKAFAEPCDCYFTSKQMRDYARTALAARQPVGEAVAYQIREHIKPGESEWFAPTVSRREAWKSLPKEHYAEYVAVMGGYGPMGVIGQPLGPVALELNPYGPTMEVRALYAAPAQAVGGTDWKARYEAECDRSQMLDDLCTSNARWLFRTINPATDDDLIEYEQSAEVTAEAVRLLSSPAQTVDLDELRRAVCVVNVVGQIDGHDVVRRNSVLDVIDVRRQRKVDSQAVGK